MLTCLRKGFELIAQHGGAEYTLENLPREDPRVYDMLCAADAIGVFQVESRAQLNFLPRMRPRVFYDLVIEVAIVRPGPIQGGMVHPYINRRQGKEPVNLPSTDLKAVLERTLGVPLFQEQAMQIAVVAAGFTPEEADRLRRSLATFKRMGTIGTFRDRFLAGHGRTWLRPRLRRSVLCPDRGVRRIRLSRIPRRQLRASGLCLGLDEAPPPGGLRLRAPELAAHGLLRPRPDRPRRARAWDRGAPRLGQPFRLGQHAGTPRRRTSGAAAGISPDQGAAGRGCRMDRRRARQRLPGCRKPLAPRRGAARRP
jgi:hypothetical protein